MRTVVRTRISHSWVRPTMTVSPIRHVMQAVKGYTHPIMQPSLPSRSTKSNLIRTAVPTPITTTATALGIDTTRSLHSTTVMASSTVGESESANGSVVPLPLRTFIFFSDGKHGPSDFQLFRAESRLAICEWWCAGGAGKDTPYFEGRNPKEMTPQELLEFIDDWSYRSFDVLKEVGKCTTLKPATLTIETCRQTTEE